MSIVVVDMCVDQHAAAAESVHYRSGLHWVVLVVPVLLAILMGAVSGLILGLPLGVAIIVAGGGLRISAAELAVTNKRIILRAGLFQRRSFEIPLNKIGSVGVKQGLLGRRFGYGTLVVHDTDGKAEPFAQVRDVLEFGRQVQEQVSRSHSVIAS